MEIENPIALFSGWLDEATQAEPENSNAAALATANQDGIPSVRMVLLKGVDDRGFTFFTNVESRKGREIQGNPVAALCFYWRVLARQVRVEGVVDLISDQEADEYFSTRPRAAQIGAWASRQSRVMERRFELEREVEKFSAKYGVGDVLRPPFWSGFRVMPGSIEFWRERPSRLHERRVFHRDGDAWCVEELYP